MMKQVLAMFSLLILLVGCQPGPNTHLAGAGMDMFTPVRCRLHPLSRITGGTGTATQSAGPQLEARIEFTDQFGDVGKGAGSVKFELYAYAGLLPGNRGSRLQSWSEDISSPEENGKHYDAITRTYLFRRDLPAGITAEGKQFVLVATVTLPNGATLTDDLMLKLP